VTWKKKKIPLALVVAPGQTANGKADALCVTQSQGALLCDVLMSLFYV